MGARQVGQRVLLGVLCWGCCVASPTQKLPTGLMNLKSSAALLADLGKGRGTGGCSQGHSPDSVLLPWHRGHPGVPGSSWGAGASRGVPTWYRVPAKTQHEHGWGHQCGDGHPWSPAPTRWHPPVYCPRNVTAPEGLPGLFHGKRVARVTAGEGSESEAAVEERGVGWELVASAGSGPSAARSCGVTRSCLVPTVPQPTPAPCSVQGRGSGVWGGACPRHPYPGGVSLTEVQFRPVPRQRC